MTNMSDEVKTQGENDVNDSSNICGDVTSMEMNGTSTPPIGNEGNSRRNSDYVVVQNKLRYKPASDIPVGTKSILDNCKQIFEQKIQNHEIDRLINPFSEFWGKDRRDYRQVLENAKAVYKDADKRTQLNKADMKYGKPVEGTLTEKRGNKARDFIANNMIELCETIVTCGYPKEDGKHGVLFGKLFKAYERINDKVVGLLVRARRHGLLDFPGEMLYQRQDDHVEIVLFKVPKFEDISVKYIKFDYEKGQEAKERCEEAPTIQ